jgi:non-ribosomal peptide synthetase component E (peptide arylation enzyme)
MSSALYQGCTVGDLVVTAITLPVTGLGKLDKKAIRARFWQGQQRAVH